MDHPETGEEIIAEQDAKNIEKLRAELAGQKPNIIHRAFQV
jgi:NCS1 family nucleobase:cation symporter-1